MGGHDFVIEILEGLGKSDDGPETAPSPLFLNIY